MFRHFIVSELLIARVVMTSAASSLIDDYLVRAVCLDDRRAVSDAHSTQAVMH